MSELDKTIEELEAEVLAELEEALGKEDYEAMKNLNEKIKNARLNLFSLRLADNVYQLNPASILYSAAVLADAYRPTHSTLLSLLLLVASSDLKEPKPLVRRLKQSHRVLLI